MMKKRWVLVSVLVAVFAMAGVGGAVLAQEDTEAKSPVKNLISRVATILGLEDQAVQDAFDQAASELRDEAMPAKMDRLVEEGRRTREQADEYLEWQRARPDILAPGFGKHRGFGSHRGRRFQGGFHGGYRYKEAPPATDSDDTVGTSA